MSSAAVLNPTLPRDLVTAAEADLTEYLGDTTEVVRISVGVDHSYDNGPDFDPEVTVRYVDGRTEIVDLDCTFFRDELIELRDDFDDVGRPLKPFSIRFKATPETTSPGPKIPQGREAAYLEAARHGTLTTRAYRSLHRGAEDRSGLLVAHLGPLATGRVIDLGWLRYAEHGYGLVLTDAGRKALDEYERTRAAAGSPMTRIARRLVHALRIPSGPAPSSGPSPVRTD